MNCRNGSLLVGAASLLLLAVGCTTDGDDGKKTVGIEVLLCDGETKLALDAPPQDREGGQQVAMAMMKEWLEKNPGADWEMQVRKEHYIAPSADNTAILADGQTGDVGGNFTERDLLVWKRETETFVVNGARIFHDGNALGSTISVSCDMCHPDASNTHPETYPKFQVQLGKVVLLRDMINWCVQHPVRGKALEPDGETMRALEAYIYAQRTGTPLQYGKH